MTDHPGLYADIGNFDSAEIDEVWSDFVTTLAAGAETQRVAERLMFGTDWYMAARNRNFEGVLGTAREAVREALPPMEGSFMGGAALHSGFNDPSNLNTQRVHARFVAENVPPPDWLAQ